MNAPGPGNRADLFRLDRVKTIGLVVVIVAALAGAGLLAGALAGDDGPALGEVKISNEPGDIVGARLRGEMKPFVAAEGGLSEGVFAVGALNSQFGVTPSPIQSPSPADGGGGVTVGGLATFPVPEGWTVAYEGETELVMDDGENILYAVTGNAGPEAIAAAVLQGLFDEVVGTTPGYSQIKTTESFPIDPFGNLTSAATLQFRAVVTPNGAAAFEIYGQFFTALRNDGRLLAVSVNTTPPSEFATSIPEWEPVVVGGYNSFAGV